MSPHLTGADRTLSEELSQRWPTVRPFAVAGSVCIVAGGLVAAVAAMNGGRERVDHGSAVIAPRILARGMA